MTNVLDQLIVKLNDQESNYEEDEPCNLIALIVANTKPETVIDAKQLKAIRDEPITFDREKKLATQFTIIHTHVEELTLIHEITTSGLKW